MAGSGQGGARVGGEKGVRCISVIMSVTLMSATLRNDQSQSGGAYAACACVQTCGSSSAGQSAGGAGDAGQGKSSNLLLAPPLL